MTPEGIREVQPPSKQVPPAPKPKLREYTAQELGVRQVSDKPRLTHSLADKLSAKFAPPPPVQTRGKAMLARDLEELEGDDDEDLDDAWDDDEDYLGECIRCEEEAIIDIMGNLYCAEHASVRREEPKQPDQVLVLARKGTKPSVVSDDEEVVSVEAEVVESEPEQAIVPARTSFPFPAPQVPELVVKKESPLDKILRTGTEGTTAEFGRRVAQKFLENRNQNTLDAYRRDLDIFAKFLEVETRDDAVAKFLCLSGPQANELVFDWVNAMGDQGLSPATIDRRIGTLKAVVKLARILGTLTWKIEITGPKIKKYRDTRGPDVDQFVKLLKAADDPGPKGARDRAILLVAIGLGLRRNELASLRMKDYDAEGKKLYVQGKGGENRWVAMPGKLIDAIEIWLAVRTDETTGESPLFASLDRASKGLPLTSDGIYYIITALGKKAGIKVRPHGLRHAAITLGLDVHKDIRSVQKFARHSNVTTTMIYDDNRKDLAIGVAETILDTVEKAMEDG